MPLPPDHALGPSLTMLEGGLTVIAIAVSFAWPRLGDGPFRQIERLFGRLARHDWWSVIFVGMAALLLRIAILPFCPIPHPFIPDDFSLLLAADTFNSGRLANPTPAMWTHFESIHITMQPTYVSMYFPGIGLLLAVARLLTGEPWIGVLLVNALMCAAICWMLQAWLPKSWALLGGLLAVLRLGLFSYWINTYTGAGGALAALGGALILGGMPRFTRSRQLRYAALMGAGAALLILTRPYEGVLLSLPVAVYLAHWALFDKRKPSVAVLLRAAAGPLALVLLAVSWLGYYDYRAFGNALTLPYTVNRAQYAMAPYYVWQAPRPEPAYRHAEMRRFYIRNEMRDYKKMNGSLHLIAQTFFKMARGLRFFAGIALLPVLVMLRRIFLDRRIRFCLICLVTLAAGMSIEIFLLPHYLAACTVAFYAVGLQAMRHLRLRTVGGQPVGRTLVRLCVSLCLALALIRPFVGVLHIRIPENSASDFTDVWYGPGEFGKPRALAAAQMDALPEKSLVIVRYAPDHNALDEWVYNSANIDSSKVIWAREMDPANNLELIHYYKDRTVYLLEPDAQPFRISAYPLQLSQTAAIQPSMPPERDEQQAESP